MIVKWDWLDVIRTDICVELWCVGCAIRGEQWCRCRRLQSRGGCAVV